MIVLKSLGAFLIVAVVLLLVSVACDPGHSVTFINETDQDVELFSSGLSAGNLAAHKERTLSYSEYAGDKLFEVRSSSGATLYSKSLSWDDLRDLNWRIRIVD
jgi:hypothetical protein